MEIDVTKFYDEEDPCLYSASRMELGDNAGQITWRNACKIAEDYDYLNTEEKRDEFRDYIEGYGAWERDEIDSWTDNELNALLVQEVASSMREKEYYDTWEEYCEASGRIYRGDDKKVFIYIGE